MIINPSTIGNAQLFVKKHVASAKSIGVGYYHTWYLIEAEGFVMVFKRGRFSDHNVTYPVCWVEQADSAYIIDQLQGFVDRDTF